MHRIIIIFAILAVAFVHPALLAQRDPGLAPGAQADCADTRHHPLLPTTLSAVRGVGYRNAPPSHDSVCYAGDVGYQLVRVDDPSRWHVFRTVDGDGAGATRNSLNRPFRSVIRTWAADWNWPRSPGHFPRTTLDGYQKLRQLAIERQLGVNGGEQSEPLCMAQFRLYRYTDSWGSGAKLETAATVILLGDDQAHARPSAVHIARRDDLAGNGEVYSFLMWKPYGDDAVVGNVPQWIHFRWAFRLSQVDQTGCH